MTLRHLHTGCVQRVGLVFGLHTLGDDLERRGPQQGREAAHPARGRFIGRDLRDQRPVDLDEIELAAREQSEIGAGQRRVIERDARPGLRNAVQRVEPELVGDAAFGDLEDQLPGTRTQTRLRRRILEPAST